MRKDLKPEFYVRQFFLNYMFLFLKNIDAFSFIFSFKQFLELLHKMFEDFNANSSSKISDEECDFIREIKVSKTIVICNYSSCLLNLD